MVEEGRERERVSVCAFISVCVCVRVCVWINQLTCSLGVHEVLSSEAFSSRVEVIHKYNS